MHALLGENGAGKSTLSNILTGLYHPDEGEIELYGRPVELPLAARRARRRDRHGAPALPARRAVHGRRERRPRRPPRRRPLVPASTRARSSAGSAELGERYGIAVDPRARIWQLSVGEQQRVEILKALYREARILILDEPTAVLTPQEAESLFETLRAMAAEGRTVIFISHKLHEVTAVADRVTVLRGGRSIATVDDGRRDAAQSLAALMVGPRRRGRRGAASAARDRRRRARARRTSRRAATAATTALRDVSLDGARGRGLGVAGVAGNGQRELAEAVTGMRPLDGAVASRSAARRCAAAIRARRSAAGVAHVPGGPARTPASRRASASRRTSSLKAYRGRRRPAGPFLRLRRDPRPGGRADPPLRRARRRARPRRRGSSRAATCRRSSSAREFSGEPQRARRRGADARPRRRRDRDRARATCATRPTDGVGVLLISEDLDEVLALADRIVVMYEGAIVGEVDAARARPSRSSGC